MIEMECFNCGNSDCKCSVTFKRECYVCNRAFYSTRSLRSHLQTHSETRRHQCDICEETFTGKEYLRLHKRLHAGNKLLITSVANTYSANNSGEFFDAKPAKRKRKFKCDVCDKKFFLEYHLAVHKRKHRDAVEKYTCIICDRGYNGPDTLKIHMATHSYNSIFACNVCEKTFTGKSYLKLHMRIHMPAKTYDCFMCGDTFRAVHILSSHIKKRHKQRNYKCELCGQVYSSKVAFAKHRNGHFDNGDASVQKTQCDYCDEHITNSDVPAHCERNRDDKKNLNVEVVKRPHHCDICGKCFILNLNLNLHLKMQHSIQVSNQNESY